MGATCLAGRAATEGVLMTERMIETQAYTATTLSTVTAHAVATLEWISAETAALVVPVYQRQYRWEIDDCKRLLDDLRNAARASVGQPHFFGSILYTVTDHGEYTERMLVDGQQRVTTLMLLIAALRDTLSGTDKDISVELKRILQHPTYAGQPRLKLRKEGERELSDIVLSRLEPDGDRAVSHVKTNYDFFLREIRDDARDVLDGLRRLVHVAINLHEHVGPQQVFESLNSTGSPLRNHELIHNFVLMGVADRQQVEIENTYWIPIEEYTGDSIDNFLRDYLVLRTGRDSDFGGDRGVYEVFKKEFPTPKYPWLTEQAAEWKAYSEVYGILLDPAQCGDEEVARHLRHCNTFGTAMYPLLLGVYRDYQLGQIDKTALIEILEQLQSLYIRKMVVGSSRDHLAAQLCRKWQQYGYPIRDISRWMPTDERVRQALKHNTLPHADYVLRRIEEPHDLNQVGDLQIEHIFPQFPGNTWSADGGAEWGYFTEAERASYREALSTIGNLALLEPALNAGASNKPFLSKTRYYQASKVPSTTQLAGIDAWSLERIADRTSALTEKFLQVWKRPTIAGMDVSEHLVPILDVPRKPGYYTGWKTEFEYVQFNGEVWEVRNTKDLFQRVFERLWETNRSQVLDYSASHNGPVFKTEAWTSRWERLGDHYLFMGLFPQYMLAVVQGILDELDMADDVFVNYSTNED